MLTVIFLLGTLKENLMVFIHNRLQLFHFLVVIHQFPVSGNLSPPGFDFGTDTIRNRL